MELPAEYLRQTLEILRPLTAANGSLPTKTVQSALGKVARISYVVPDAAPFVASLWAAFSEGRRQAELEAPGTSKHWLPACRFAQGAAWCTTLISEALQQKDFGLL